MRLIRVKTDKVDAMLIAQYGKLKKSALWQPTPDLLAKASQEMNQT